MSGGGDELRLDAFLPYRLSIASNAVSKLIARTYERAFDLSIPEWRLLAVLNEIGAGTQQALVRRTLMDKVAVSRAAQALAERGLIERVEDAADARARRVSLSESGRALHAAIAPLALAYERRLVASLAPEEVETLHALLARLERAVDTIAREDEQALEAQNARGA